MDTEPSVAFAPVGVMASEQAWGKDWYQREGGSLGWAPCILGIPAGSCPSYQSVKGFLQILMKAGGVRRDLEPEEGEGKLGSIAYKL